MADMRETDPVVGFNITVAYNGGTDGVPVISGAPIRQRADGVDYIDRTETTGFIQGVAGIEAWMGVHLKRELGKQGHDRAISWRSRYE